MVIKQVQSISLWDKEAGSTVLAGVRLAPGSAEFKEVTSQLSSSPSKEHCSIGLPMFTPSLPPSSPLATSSCSVCGVTLASRDLQVEHYRTTWHLHNLRRSNNGRSPLSLQQFQNQGEDSNSSSDSEDSSSVDSDGEDDEESERSVLGRQPRLFFLNADGNVISLYRTVLFNKRVEMDGEQDAVQRLQGATRRQRWAIILLSGGHFAAAIYTGPKVEVRKTFHNYTVRAKQGGSQAGQDNQSGTSHAKSSGASLRRYNQQSQRQHIQDLMESWRPQLASCDLIFCHTKHIGRPALFGGRQPILNSLDDRLRNIPFCTRRPKFAEVQRVHSALSEILVHGTEEEFQTMVKESQEAVKKQPKPAKTKTKETSPSKSPRKSKTERRKDSDQEKIDEEEEEEEDGEMVLVTRLETISMGDLGGRPDWDMGSRSDQRNKHKKEGSAGREEETTNERTEDDDLGSKDVKKMDEDDWGNDRGKGRGKNKSKKKRKAGQTDGKTKGCPHKKRVWQFLATACKTGNINHLALALKRTETTDECQTQDEALDPEMLTSIATVELPENLSEVRFIYQKRCMLHVAAENGQAETIRWLLIEGCDPCTSDSNGRVPYDDASDKTTRNVFRRFMAEFPERYDYVKAKIPSPLSQAQEEEQLVKQAARRKTQRQAKQERQKEKKRKEKEDEEREREARKEEEEKRRYLLLSDREKRALAAERRILGTGSKTSASSNSTPCLVRCFQCGADITGMVPYEYSDYRFCSSSCVREHRIKPNS